MIAFCENTCHRVVWCNRIRPGGSTSRHNHSDPASTDVTNILFIYFNVAYYLGVSPFRFVRNGEGRQSFRKHTWKPQQVVCVILYVLGFFSFLSDWRGTFDIDEDKVSAEIKNPKRYLRVLWTFIGICYDVIIVKIFWFNNDEYLTILNALPRNKPHNGSRAWLAKPIFLYLFYGFFALRIIPSMLGGVGFIPVELKWDPSWWIRALVYESKYLFFLPSIENITDTPEVQNMTALDGCFAFLTLVAYSSEYVICTERSGLLSEVSELLIVTFAFTLWITANSFATGIQGKELNFANKEPPGVAILDHCSNKLPDVHSISTINPAWSKMYTDIIEIVKLSEMIQFSIGSLVVSLTMGYLLFYAMEAQSLFTSDDGLEAFLNFTGFIEGTFMFYIAADIPNQMNALESWLRENDNRKSLPTNDVNLVLQILNNNAVGIHGGSMFTITYSFMGGFCGMLVTFFIICVEYE